MLSGFAFFYPSTDGSGVQIERWLEGVRRGDGARNERDRKGLEKDQSQANKDNETKNVNNTTKYDYYAFIHVGTFPHPSDFFPYIDRKYYWFDKIHRFKKKKKKRKKQKFQR